MCVRAPCVDIDSNCFSLCLARLIKSTHYHHYYYSAHFVPWMPRAKFHERQEENGLAPSFCLSLGSILSRLFFLFRKLLDILLKHRL